MKINGNVNFAENSIYSQILGTYLNGIEHFSILKIFENNGNVNFA